MTGTIGVIGVTGVTGVIGTVGTVGFNKFCAMKVCVVLTEVVFCWAARPIVLVESMACVATAETPVVATTRAPGEFGVPTL